MSGYDTMSNPWEFGDYQNVRCARGIVNVDNQCVCPANGLMTPPYTTDSCANPGRYHNPTAPITSVARELMDMNRPNIDSQGRVIQTGTDGASMMQAPYL